MHINCDNFNIYRRSLVFPSAAAITRHDVAISLFSYFFVLFSFNLRNLFNSISGRWPTMGISINQYREKKWELNGIESDDNRDKCVWCCDSCVRNQFWLWETIFVFIYLLFLSASSRHKSISRLWKLPHRWNLEGADAAIGRKEDFELSYIILMMQ